MAERYDQGFAKLAWLQTPAKTAQYEHGYQSYPCLFQPERAKAAAVTRNTGEIKAINEARNAWMDHLQQVGISTRPATHAVHMLSFYQQRYRLQPGDFPNAFAANDCSISLPLFHGLTQEEQNFVISTVRAKV